MTDSSDFNRRARQIGIDVAILLAAGNGPKAGKEVHVPMKVVIFAGGIGTRISEESYLKPKPMIEIGEKPILWHLMKIYEAQGFSDFVICVGYKSYLIKEYFLNYYVYNSDVTVNLLTNSFESTGPTRKNSA